MDSKEQIALKMKQYFENQGITQSKVAETIGASKQYVNGICKGRNVIGKVKALQLEKYFGLSSSWLLTGKGEMLLEGTPIRHEEPETPTVSTTSGRPYYNVDFIGGFDMVLNDQTATPEYNIDFTPYNQDGVCWCNISGHSMEPKISNGDIIALKEVVGWADLIDYGEIYAIVTTNDLRTVKILRKGSDNEHYRLVPINTEEYDEQEIEKTSIARIFRVVGCMKKI